MKDLFDEISEIDQEEARVKARKDALRANGLAKCKQLIEVFSIDVSELFDVSAPKATKTASTRAPVETFDFAGNGFEMDAVYKGQEDGKDVFYQLTKGRQPLWLIKLAREGKRHADLLATPEEAKQYLIDKAEKKAEAEAKKAEKAAK